MKAQEVTEIIEKELEDAQSIQSAHTLDIEKCVISPPVQLEFEDSFNEGKTIKLWLVLEESPKEKSGYKIVFNEESGQFGLATPGFHKLDSFIGYYGTFLETLKSM